MKSYSHKVLKALDKELLERRASLERMSELQAAAAPLLDFLNRHYDPMCYALVTEGNVQILRGEMGVPLPVRD